MFMPKEAAILCQISGANWARDARRAFEYATKEARTAKHRAAALKKAAEMQETADDRYAAARAIMGIE